MNSKHLIFVGAFYNLAFFVYHAFFWKLFDWKEDLAKLTPPNNSVMQILNLCLMFVFVIFAYLSAFQTNELLETKLGRAVLLSIAVFWFLRAVEQVVFGGLGATTSIVFFAVFLFGALLYLIPALRLFE